MANALYDLVAQMSTMMVNQLETRMMIFSNRLWQRGDPSIVIEESKELTAKESSERQTPKRGDVEKEVMVL